MENFTTTRIGIAGDWHGDTDWIIGALKEFKINGITEVYHVGDFGFWPGREGEKFLRAVERQLALYEITIYVTLGNHEDYVQINALPVSDDGMRWATPHIAVMPRGYRWMVGETSFVSLGGAPSINFEDLREGFDWWPEEALTMGDVYRVAEGGHADVMITHDAPDGIPTLDRLMAANAREWSPEGLQYASEGRALMNQALLSVQPHFFFHGHYHYDYIDDGSFDDWNGSFTTTFIGTHRNRRNNNIMVFDVETKEMEWLTLAKFFIPESANDLRV